MSDRRKQVTLGAILSYFSIAFNIIAGLLYTPWMVSQIGQNQYGLYTLATSLISVFLVDFGLSSATARYVSKYHAEGDDEKVNSFLGTIYKLYLIIDAGIFIALIIVYFLSGTIYKRLTPEELSQFKVVYVIAAFYSLFNFPFITLNGILTANERFIEQKLGDLIQRALTIALVVIALLNGMGLYALVAANAVAGVVVIVYKLVMIKRRTTVKIIFRKNDPGMLKEIFSFSVWMTVASLAQRLVFNITPSVLGMVANSAAIAVFGIVTTIEGYAYTITNAINGMFMPKISRIYAGRDTETSIQPLLLRVGRFQFAINGLIVAGFSVIGKQFIILWMGSNYIDAYYGLVLVLIPGLFYNSLQIGHTSLMVKNKVSITAYVNLGMGLMNMVLCYIFARWIGVLGASLAIFISYMVRAVALNILYERVLDVSIGEFVRKCYIKMSPSVLLTIAVGFIVQRMIGFGGWIKLGITGAIVVFIYVGLLFTIGFEKSEKEIVIAKVKRLICKNS